MPITGKFLADFASFYDAVQKAEVSLKSFETGAGKVGQSLNRMADSFSGRKIISEAELAVRAVNDIGGAALLTENEQRRLNTTLSEALAKYKALGFTAPPDMLRLAEATKQVERETGKIPTSLKGITSSLSGIAGAFGIAFSVGAIVNFGKSVFDSASKIHDLSSQLGISTDAVQGFKYAAEQSGSSLDAVGTAITKMNNNLSEGGKGTIAALKDAGLRFQDIRNMKPEDAFLAIADAIQKIPDPMKQSEVALQLFGRGAAELLPGIKEGFRGAAEGADKMSEDTIKDLEAAQDAWGKLANKVTIVSGTIIAETMKVTSQVTSNWKNFFMFVDNAMRHGIGMAGAMADLTAEASKVSGTKDINLSLPTKPLKDFTEAQSKAASAARQHADAIKDLADVLSGANLVRQMQDLDAATTRLVASHRLDAAAKERVAEAAGKLFRAGVPLTPQLFGLAMQFGELNPKTIAGAQGLTEFGQAVHLTVPDVQMLGDLLPRVTSGIGDLTNVLPKADLAYQFGRAKAPIQDVRASIGDLSQALSQLAQVSGGAFGSIVRDLSSLVAAADAANKSLESIKSGREAWKDGSTFQGILGMTTGVLGLVSAAIAAGKAIANLFDRNKGRDVVVEFADTHGGFDRLHDELLTLGDEGEQLWIRLTQGVGRNNPAQAQAAIDAINEALARHKQTLEDAADAATAMGEAESEAMQRARAEVARLDDQIKSLQASIANEAPEEVMGVIEQQTRAQIAAIQAQRDAAQQAIDDVAGDAAASAEHAANAIQETLDAHDFVAKLRFEYELPEGMVVPTGREEPGFAGGTHGQYLDFGAGTRVTLHGRERVMTEAESRSGAGGTIVVQLVTDGRTLAEVTVPHIPDVVQSYGLA